MRSDNIIRRTSTTRRLAGCALSVLFVLSGCASSTTERKEEAALQKKVEATPAPNAPGDIATRGHQAFLNAPGLTDAQRIKLSEIMGQTYAEAGKIKTEIGQSKMVLFKSITSPVPNKKEVSMLKKKITKLDQKRLELMFKALDEVQKVIGRNPETAEYIQTILKAHIRDGEATL